MSGLVESTQETGDRDGWRREPVRPLPAQTGCFRARLTPMSIAGLALEVVPPKLRPL
jgi:hypothetical protein